MTTGYLKTRYKDLVSLHRQGPRGNIFLFTSPRSGSSWVAELIARQPRMKYVNEPFDLRRDDVPRYLGISDWAELYSNASRERVRDYLEFFVSGRSGSNFCSPSVRSDLHHFRTDRAVYKILHACEHWIEWLREACGAHVVLLLRHPMAVSLSRETTPRLQTFLESDYASRFSAAELDYAHDVLAGGDPLHHKVLDWCLQNAVPLRDARPEWTVIGYEELVADPPGAVAYLTERLALEATEESSASLAKPSTTVYKSDAETRERFGRGEAAERREWLLSKWKKKTTDREEREAMEIVAFFGIDRYRYGSVMPTVRTLPPR